MLLYLVRIKPLVDTFDFLDGCDPVTYCCKDDDIYRECKLSCGAFQPRFRRVKRSLDPASHHGVSSEFARSSFLTSRRAAVVTARDAPASNKQARACRVH